MAALIMRMGCDGDSDDDRLACTSRWASHHPLEDPVRQASRAYGVRHQQCLYAWKISMLVHISSALRANRPPLRLDILGLGAQMIPTTLESRLKSYPGAHKILPTELKIYQNLLLGRLSQRRAQTADLDSTGITRSSPRDHKILPQGSQGLPLPTPKLHRSAADLQKPYKK